MCGLAYAAVGSVMCAAEPVLARSGKVSSCPGGEVSSVTSPEAPKVIDFRTYVVFHHGLGVPALFCMCQMITQSVTEGPLQDLQRTGCVLL